MVAVIIILVDTLVSTVGKFSATVNSFLAFVNICACDTITLEADSTFTFIATHSILALCMS